MFTMLPTKFKFPAVVTSASVASTVKVRSAAPPPTNVATSPDPVPTVTSPVPFAARPKSTLASEPAASTVTPTPVRAFVIAT